MSRELEYYPKRKNGLLMVLPTYDYRSIVSEPDKLTYSEINSRVSIALISLFFSKEAFPTTHQLAVDDPLYEVRESLTAYLLENGALLRIWCSPRKGIKVAVEHDEDHVVYATAKPLREAFASHPGFELHYLSKDKPKQPAPQHGLPDAEIERIVSELPDGAVGYARTWGYMQLARAIEDAHGITLPPKGADDGKPA